MARKTSSPCRSPRTVRADISAPAVQSKSGREPDGQPRPGLDHGTQRRVTGCGFGTMREADVAMFDFLGPKLFERGLERRFVIAERLDLIAIMLVDHFLD